MADFDNDGYPDLFISGAGEQRLFRNRRDGTFEDVTAKAGLGELRTVCLGSTFVDLDEDGDLDLLIAECGRTPEEALAALRGERLVATDRGTGMSDGVRRRDGLHHGTLPSREGESQIA